MVGRRDNFLLGWRNLAGANCEFQGVYNYNLHFPKTNILDPPPKKMKVFFGKDAFVIFQTGDLCQVPAVCCLFFFGGGKPHDLFTVDLDGKFT